MLQQQIQVLRAEQIAETGLEAGIDFIDVTLSLRVFSRKRKTQLPDLRGSFLLRAPEDYCSLRGRFFSDFQVEPASEHSKKDSLFSLFKDSSPLAMQLTVDSVSGLTNPRELPIGPALDLKIFATLHFRNKSIPLLMGALLTRSTKGLLVEGVGEVGWRKLGLTCPPLMSWSVSKTIAIEFSLRLPELP